MLNELIGTLTQVIIFALIPFFVYLIGHKKVKGFFSYVGLKRSTLRANLLALLVSLIFLLPALGMIMLSEEMKEILLNPGTMTGKFREMGPGWESVLILMMTALVKTSFSEELLFRGFFAKRLIAWLGFPIGNIAQSVLFGGIHLLLFLGITRNPAFLAGITVFASLGAWLSAILNEKFARGSILPGWISHGLANVVSYTLIAFII